MPRFNYSLDEQFTLEGIWWVPSKPELGRKQGVLTFEPGIYIQLKLDGLSALSDLRFRGIGRFTQRGYQIIKGKTETGYSVLLFDSQTFAFEVFYPRLVLVSDQEIPWNEPDEVKFRRLTARFTYLEEWRNIFPFDEKNKSLNRYAAEYVSPEPIIAPVSSLNAEIRFVPHFQSFFQLTEAVFKYRMFAEVVANQPQHIDWLLVQLRHVRDLLALLIGEPVRELNRIARLDKSETSSETGQMIHIFHSVPIPSPIKFTTPDSMLSATLLDENLPDIVDAWFRPELFELWEVLRDVYFGVYYEAVKVPRFQFLALMQVLENYHRRKYGGEYLSKDEYEPIRQKLTDAIPSDVSKHHRDSLKSRIEYGYQYSLRKRFLLLLDLVGGSLQGVLGIKKKDLDRIVATRNYYTHYDPEDLALTFNEQELLQVNSRLVHMIVALILKQELKNSEDQIEGFLRRRKDIGRLW